MNQELINAIRNSQRITFDYLKEGESAPSARIFEPVIYGIRETGGNELVGGYEPGSGFKMFKVSGIQNLETILTEGVAMTPVPARVSEWAQLFAER